MRKPTPDELQRARAGQPEGSPRFDYREMDLAVEVRKAAEDNTETMTIACSSEHPVMRYDVWRDEEYYEVLDHTPTSIDLSYARDGMPFVMSHRAHDGDQQHGIVENVRVENRRLMGDVRFSKSQRSQEIAQDIRDGIRKKVSVGYIVGPAFKTEGNRSGVPVRRYMNWMPVETSTVPIPADPTVGIGRAATAAGQEALARFLELYPTAPTGKEKTMYQDTAPSGATNAGQASGTPDIRVIEREANEKAALRANNIVAMAAQHGLADKAAEWLRAGKSEGDVAAEINTVLSARLKDATTIQQSRGVELSEKQYKKFSYARALLADPDLNKIAREDGNNIDIGFEREVIQEARRSSPMSTNSGRLFLPYVTTRANIDSATATTGGAFKFTQPGDFIDLLRNAASVTRAGATMLTGLTGPVSFPKQNGAATASWVSENPGSDMSRTALAMGTVSLAFKTVQAATAVSRQALFSAASGNYDLEAIIRNDLAKVIALAIDLGALNGLGSSNQPLGILQDTSVGTATALGTNGGTVAWSNVIDLESQPAIANASGSSFAYLTNAKQRKQARQVAVLGNTVSGVPLWQSAPSMPDAGGGHMPSPDGTVNGYRAYVSNQVPSNLTKGTSTTICSAWVFGAFEHLLIGTFGSGFEVLVDPYTLKLQNMIDLTAWNFVDVANRYPVAFATIKDAL